MNKIFVAGGRNQGDNRINNVEIVSTSTISRERGSSSGCRSIKDYPHTMSSGFGTYIGDHPLICGGYDLDVGDPTNKCYEYSVVANDWTETAPMLEARSYAAAVTINSTHWWVTGGRTSSSGRTKSTEIYEDGKGFKVSAMCITQDLKIIHICIYWSREIPHKAILRYHT